MPDSLQTTSQTTTTSEPSSIQTPFIQDLFTRAQGAINQVPRGVFQGPLVARPTAPQLAGLEGAAGAAQNFFGAGDPVVDFASASARGDFLDPASNPAFQQALQSALNPTFERFTEQVLPSISSAAISQGAFGGDRQGVIEQQALRDFGRSANEVAGNLAFNQFNQERDRQFLSPQALQQGLGLNLAGPSALQQVGSTLRGFDQDIVNENVQRFNQLQEAPFAGLDRFASLIGIPVPGSGTSTSTTQGLVPGQPSTAQNIFSGVLGGASTGGLLGNQLGGGDSFTDLLPFILGGGLLGGIASIF